MKWFNIQFESPLNTWWMVRKYFKFPDISIKWSFRKDPDLKSRLLTFVCADVAYDEDDLYQRNPIIAFSLFNILCILICLGKKCDNIDVSNAYWDTIYDYLYQTDYSLYQACLNNIRYTFIKGKKIKEKPVKFALTEKGKELYIKEKIETE
jgi:hypothetical protein